LRLAAGYDGSVAVAAGIEGAEYHLGVGRSRPVGGLLALVGAEAFGDPGCDADRSLPDEIPVRDIGQLRGVVWRRSLLGDRAGACHGWPVLAF
jgi:hypothetical protein